MLTPDDIKLIIEANKQLFYTKDEAVSKQDFKELRADFRSLQTSVDKMTTIFQKYHDEQQALVGKLKHIEDWVKKAAAKLGVEYNP